MKKILAFLFIGLLNFTNHAFSDEKILNYLKEGKKLIFIRHAIAPGNGDPDNFNIKDCSSQRNLRKINNYLFLQSFLIHNDQVHCTQLQDSYQY